MTDQQILRHHADGYAADVLPRSQDAADETGFPQPDYAQPEYDESGYGHGGEWDGGQWDGGEWDGGEWDGYVAAARPTTPPRVLRPWYRDPRWLFGLIALAAAALIVATVLLITGRRSGEIPTAPELTTRTPSSATSAPSPRSTPPGPSVSPTTTPTSAASTTEQPSAVDIPAAVPPMASAAEPPPEPTASRAGPRINVTRTPMSFSPGKH